MKGCPSFWPSRIAEVTGCEEGGVPTPHLFVSADSTGVTGELFVSADSTGVISPLFPADPRGARKCGL